ncbi:hypothetical protein BGZ63DRAFT_454039 [Mariannaea sp. PMI_226]|nr:hypothetical protein BGZ63DRAFT_454039 [Mariannaea sp. PMI_226]
MSKNAWAVRPGELEFAIMLVFAASRTTKAFHVLEEEKGSEKRWLVKPVVKNVPKNLWGEYDPRTDPALRGNAVSSLLNAPKAPGSMPLDMELSFQPPLPSTSKDKVDKFSIVSDMLKRVGNNGYPF